MKVGDTEILASIGAVSGRALLRVIEEAPSAAEVAAVKLEPTSLTLTEGDRHQLAATPVDADGRPITGRGMFWTIGNQEIVLLEQGSGEVTALKSGTTDVSVRVDGKSASATVRVESFYSHGLIYSQSVAVATSGLYTLDINDSAGPEIPIVLPNSSSIEPTASPDGTKIAFVVLTPAETSIYVAARNGSNPVRLTTNPGKFDQPAWSPDGTLIAFRGRPPGADADIWVMSPDGANAVSLTADHGPTNQASPAWSSQPIDGSYRIAYSHSESGMGHLWTMRADGSDKLRITASVENYDDMPSWSPDGQTIVFARSGPAIFGDLYVVEATGGAGRLLTQLTGPIHGAQLEPSWSPDGVLIAFVSSHTAQEPQIYTVWADGTRIVKRTSDPFRHSRPSWILN